MTLQEAIQVRRSVRKYTAGPIAEEAVARLREEIDACNREGGLHIQLVLDEPKAFKGKMAYGSFSGVVNYLALVGPAGKGLDEKIGYYGQRLVLHATALGLKTCWVGLTYNNIHEAYQLAPGEKLVCLIALGYSESEGLQIKRRGISDVSNYEAGMPDWFLRGVEAALLAPTAVNQQKFYLRYEAGKDGAKDVVRAERKLSVLPYTRIDLGIVRLHFELAAGDNFVWG